MWQNGECEKIFLKPFYSDGLINPEIWNIPG